MPKREDTTRDGYHTMPETCPHGHWVGLRCDECEKVRLGRRDLFADVVWLDNREKRRRSGESK